MATQDAKGTTATAHTREQLLRMLKRDPTSVSRAEIKAAFQDGRLGDEDLDIPTLAGMKRISELLDELEPAPADPAPGSAKARRRATGRRNTDAPPDTAPPPRPLSEVDQIVAALAMRVDSLERLVREREVDIESLRRKFDAVGPGGAIRRLWVALLVVGIVAVIALVVALTR
ncbi:MAG: hypothetical protein U0667_10400 [Chloroflexota bacterium]|jgi:hypothetical protein